MEIPDQLWNETLMGAGQIALDRERQFMAVRHLTLELEKEKEKVAFLEGLLAQRAEVEMELRDQIKKATTHAYVVKTGSEPAAVEGSAPQAPDAIEGIPEG